MCVIVWRVLALAITGICCEILIEIKEHKNANITGKCSLKEVLFIGNMFCGFTVSNY